MIINKYKVILRKLMFSNYDWLYICTHINSIHQQLMYSYIDVFYKYFILTYCVYMIKLKFVLIPPDKYLIYLLIYHSHHHHRHYEL